MGRTLREILCGKRRKLVIADVNVAPRRAIHMMNDAKVGSVLVTAACRLVGIFTERDVLERIVEGDVDIDTATLAEVMTSPVRCVSPDMPISEAMALMTREKRRHLPVVEGDELRGLVSLGDLTHWLSRDLQQSVVELTRYVAGPAAMLDVPFIARAEGLPIQEDGTKRWWFGLAHPGARAPDAIASLSA